MIITTILQLFLVAVHLRLQFVGHQVYSCVHISIMHLGIEDMPRGIDRNICNVTQLFVGEVLQHHLSINNVVEVPTEASNLSIDIVFNGIRQIQMLPGNSNLHGALLTREVIVMNPVPLRGPLSV
ncbi:protein of unknown function [Acidithiobacillus ferrivorans]|uniref:Secreted protein n=1 Tax=Acidithiobacillus ferrivorans TaxID=160808 RepID=A0ABY1MT43_9PROT|nr:protein of unknown function [Acidithiobacillus ferrivorans]